MDTISPIPSKPASTKKLIGFLALFLLAGMILAGVLIYFWQAGWFIRWELVGQLPDPAAKIIYTDPWNVSVQTSDRRVLTCHPGNSKECWFPDVITDPRALKECDIQQAAFQPMLKPPTGLAQCLQADGGMAETSYSVIYAVDREQNVWKWEQSRSAYEILVIPVLDVAGGLLGVLFGSLVWAGRRFARNKRGPSQSPAFSRIQIAILLIPWLCVMCAALSLYLALSPSSSSGGSSSPSPLYTAAAETVTAQLTVEAQSSPAQATPGPGPLRYSFAEHACDAKWMNPQSKIPCSTGAEADSAAVRKAPAANAGGGQAAGEAIWVPMGSNGYVYSEHPEIEIQPGDHFKSSISCRLADSTCEIIFEVMFDRSMIGRWEIDRNGGEQDIDVDLSKFAGQKGRFSLNTQSIYVRRLSDQDAVWFIPRIEK